MENKLYRLYQANAYIMMGVEFLLCVLGEAHV